MFGTVTLIFVIFTVDAWVLGYCYQMVLWDANIMHYLSLFAWFLITFETTDLMITVNSCLDLEPKEIWSSKISDKFKKDSLRFFVFSCH